MTMNPTMDNLCVADLFIPNTKNWHMENISLLFDNVSAYHISRIPLLASVLHDRAVWKLDKNGIYSVRCAYRNIMEMDPNTHQLWCTKTPPRIKNFLWRVTRGCLPTRLRLKARGVNCPSNCLFCDEDEDSLHALFLCTKSMQ